MKTEFKESAIKVNTVDMAVNILIRAIFGKIVSSFLNKEIIAPNRIINSGADFNKLTFTLK
jgi:large conductance mechanosensitive channel protein